jgi:beta-1,4-N-acetylglucosaminyltransferase
MIFVTVGTNEARFERLLDAVARVRVDEPVLVQHGHSSATAPSGAELVDFLGFDEMVATMRRARVVVTHAGVGSVMVALANGRRPVVVPRLQKFGEAVDDHQLQLARRFAAAGFVTLLEDPEQLAAAIAAVDHRASMPAGGSALATDLRRYLGSAVLA